MEYCLRFLFGGLGVLDPSIIHDLFLKKIRTLHQRKSAGPSNANFSFLPIGKRREREMLLSAIAR